jgi:predicted component of type VI protein secretion system
MFLQRQFLKRSVTEMEDIQTNLTFVFQSKRGANHEYADLGLPDMNFRTAEAAVNALKEAVPALVTRHEPRLEIVGVDDDYDDDGRPFVTVACVQRSTGARFDIIVDGSSTVARFEIRTA